MTEKRFGCHTCFHTLNPQDPQPNRQQFKCCTECGAIYHAVCWPENSPCPSCFQYHPTPYQVSPPIPLRVIQRRRPGFIRPSAVYIVDRHETITKLDHPHTLGHFVLVINDWLSALLGAVAVIALATLIGAYTFRIYSLIETGDFSATTLFDAILKQSSPPQSHIRFSAIASLVFCLFFLRTKQSGTTKSPQLETNVLLKLFSTVLLLLALDILLLDLSLSQLTNMDDLLAVWPIIVTELGAMTLLILLAPIYHYNAPSLPRITDFITPIGRNSLVMVWYLVVTLGLLKLVLEVSDTLANHSMRAHQIVIHNDQWEVSLSTLEWGAFAVALLVTLFLYRLPEHLRGHSTIRTTRLLVFLICSGIVAYSYTHSVSSETYLSFMSLVIVVTLAFIPFHYILFSMWANYRTTS